MSDDNPTFKEYLTQAGQLPSDALLGRIVLFTITDEPVKHEDIDKWFDELGLDKAMMPGQIRELDAFKKATSDAKGTYPMSRAREAFTLCRDVDANAEYTKRQITREIKDVGNKRLSYDAAIDCTFYKKSSPTGHGRVHVQVRQSIIEPEEMGPLRELANQIRDSYDRYVNFHDGQKLRGLVRNYLKHLNAIEIKGGVYFIHATKDPQLDALIELVRRFGGGCSMNTIPMVDLKQDREFIASVFEREASQALQQVAKDARTLVADRKSISDAAYLGLKHRFDEVLSNAKEHMINLQVTQDVTAAAAEIAQQELQKLQLQMVAPAPAPATTAAA